MKCLRCGREEAYFKSNGDKYMIRCSHCNLQTKPRYSVIGTFEEWDNLEGQFDIQFEKGNGNVR